MELSTVERTEWESGREGTGSLPGPQPSVLSWKSQRNGGKLEIVTVGRGEGRVEGKVIEFVSFILISA